MFFDPGCENCQEKAKELLANKDRLKDIQVLMVSASSFRDINDFYEKFGLLSMPDCKLGQDANAALGSIYRLKTFPSTFVYDQRGILAKAYVGNIGISAIIDAVK